MNTCRGSLALICAATLMSFSPLLLARLRSQNQLMEFNLFIGYSALSLFHKKVAVFLLVGGQRYVDILVFAVQP